MGKHTRVQQKNGKKAYKVSLLIIITLALCAGIYLLFVYNHVKDTVDKNIQETIKSIDNNPEKIKEGQESLNILLMGVDERTNDIGRADTLVILSLNPKNDSMQLISIPRDTLTPIYGKEVEDKINHSYVHGYTINNSKAEGINTSVATVENFLNIELDYYVMMNMEGLPDLVDAVGGITVDNPLEWYDEGYYKKGYHYEKGNISLNGPQAIGYVRMRKEDPENDFGRNKRQRLVIKGIVDKGASVGSITRIENILNTLDNNLKTNLTFEEMKNLYKNYRNTRENSISYQIDGISQKINGMWYVVVSEEERQKVHEMISEFNNKE